MRLKEKAVREIFLIRHYESPLGTYVLASSERGVVCVATEGRFERRLARWEKEDILVQDGDGHNLEAASQLDAYFAGKLHQFSVPLDLRGTIFQRQVWEFLQEIPYGETRSYGQIARALGHPAASRAVGRAIGTNPVSIIVPCHRVIGAGGELVGYGGGLERKRALLDLEAAARQQKPNI
ncbi:MAG TPA: methylated-DNA--[protein]-cysteine S-methyltransferase [Dehalococcoidia bacterium]|nr:methylated-DNA--[protein]-cysteine S-methyltransferase [Dehalococcoidia bacterium]